MKHLFSTHRSFWLTLLIPVVVLLSMTFQPLLVLAFGAKIALQTISHDLSDSFYGDDIQLKFAIEEVVPSLLDEELTSKVKNAPWDQRFPVYVSLKPQGSLYVIEQVSVKRPKAGIYLAGKIHAKPFTTEGKEGDRYSIDYPFAHFYMEKGKGSQLGKSFAKGELVVSLQVKNGYAILTGVQ
jgi:uncharacterized membrane-anchored protein